MCLHLISCNPWSPFLKAELCLDCDTAFALASCIACSMVEYILLHMHCTSCTVMSDHFGVWSRPQHCKFYCSYKHHAVFIVMNCMKTLLIEYKKKPILPTRYTAESQTSVWTCYAPPLLLLHSSCTNAWCYPRQLLSLQSSCMKEDNTV